MRAACAAVFDCPIACAAKDGGVYVIANLETRRQYIGTTSWFGRRMSHHKVLLNRGRHHNQVLQRDWSQLGPSDLRRSAMA